MLTVTEQSADWLQIPGSVEKMILGLGITGKLCESITFSVTLVQFGYHQTDEEYKQLLGCLYSVEERDRVLNISFDLRPDIPLDTLAELRDVYSRADITPPKQGKAIDVLTGRPREYYVYGFNCDEIRPKIDRTHTTYYYKAKGFNDAYNSLKQLITELTEEDFARILCDRPFLNGGYNSSLIVESGRKKEGFELFKQVEYHYEARGEKSCYACSIEIIITDIHKNMGVLRDLFEKASPYIL